MDYADNTTEPVVHFCAAAPVHIPAAVDSSTSYVTEETAPANIVSLEPTRYVSWPKSKLQDFMKKNPDLHTSLNATLAIDLTKWLQSTWDRQTS